MPKQAPTIAITGAGGFLGSRLVAYFAEKGWQVCGLVRDPSKYTVSENVTYYFYDLTKPISKNLLRDVDYLVHAAYIIQDPKTPHAFDLNISAAKNILDAGQRAKVKQKIFISSMSAHEDAVSSYGRQKFAIEKLFNSPDDLSLRPGLIIGNGGIVRTMISFMKSKHVVPLVGGGKQPLQIVNVKDLGPVIERVIDRKAHGVLTIAHPHIYTYKQFYAKLANYLHIRVLFVPVPLSGLLFAIRTINILHIPLNINSDNVLGLKKLRGVDNKKSLQKLDIKLDDLDTSLTDNKL